MDLSLVSIDELKEEIWKRYDSVVLIAKKNTSSRFEEIFYHFKDRMTCVGLMTIAIHNISESYKDQVEEDT